MKYTELDTPALLVDRDIMMDNLRFMQDYADRQGVALRPHTKTHKTPAITKLQEELGAKGITVAKVGEAEVMAENGLRDIFIAQVEHLDGEIRRLRQELALGLVDIYADLAQQSDALLIEPALVLNSNSQHNIYFFVRHPRQAPLQHLYPYIRKEAYRQR